MHLLGTITLNISTILYFIWFIPQLRLTFTRKSTHGLSLLMHSLLMLGYIMDLMYGFGQHLPIQYRLVTTFGLCSLLFEHIQFARYGLETATEKKLYSAISIGFIFLFISVFYNLFVDRHSNAYYDIAGYISSFCWIAFLWPQIMKNFINKSTDGLSTAFVWICFITSLCDIVSAYALNWSLPSKINTPIGLIQKLFLLGQCYYYARNSRIPNLSVSYT